MEPHCALDIVKKSLVYMSNKYHQQNQNSFLFDYSIFDLEK